MDAVKLILKPHALVSIQGGGTILRPGGLWEKVDIKNEGELGFSNF